MHPSQPLLSLLSVLVVVAATSGCVSPDNRGSAAPTATPVYSEETGELEQLVADRDGDGRPDTRAFMEGKRLVRIEIDRSGDGSTDRWEHYADAPPERAIQQSPAGRAEIQTVEEANGVDDRITRREFYERGELHRVEDDVDGNGQVDRWEFYTDGILARVEMDLTGRGYADRRLVYQPDGRIERAEENPDGDGNWRSLPPQSLER